MMGGFVDFYRFVWRWWSASASVTTPFRMIALTGQYDPTRALTGQYDPNRAITGG